jgi:hypothetical protein
MMDGEYQAYFLPWGDTEDLAASLEVAEGAHWSCRSVGLALRGWEGTEVFDARAMEHWKAILQGASQRMSTVSLGAAVVALGGLLISAHMIPFPAQSANGFLQAANGFVHFCRSPAASEGIWVVVGPCWGWW